MLQADCEPNAFGLKHLFIRILSGGIIHCAEELMAMVIFFQLRNILLELSQQIVSCSEFTQPVLPLHGETSNIVTDPLVGAFHERAHGQREC